MRPGELERLAFVKYLLTIAEQQLAGPEPHAAVGVLTLHDAVELFLQLVGEHVNASLERRTMFLDYWTKCRAVDVELPYFGTMQRLNDLRIALKHHGIIPRRADLTDVTVTASAFCDEVSTTVFGLAFAEISLADVVRLESARAEVIEAEKALQASDIVRSLQASARAMDTLIVDYESRKQNDWYESPFVVGGRKHHAFHKSGRLKLGVRDRAAMGRSPSGGDLRQFAGDVDDQFREVWEQLEATQEAMRIVLLGFDYRKWARFRASAPDILHMMDGRREVLEGPEGVPASEAEFCIQFVIETALRFQEFDFTAANTLR